MRGTRLEWYEYTWMNEHHPKQNHETNLVSHSDRTTAATSTDYVSRPSADSCMTCFFSCDGNALKLISGDDNCDTDCTARNVALSPNTTAARRQTCLIRGPRCSECVSTELTLTGLDSQWADCLLASASFDFNSAMRAPDSCRVPPTINKPVHSLIITARNDGKKFDSYLYRS